MTTSVYQSPTDNCQQSSAGVQLPQADIVHQAPAQEPPPPAITAPPPFTRWEWVKKMTRLHKLTLAQRSVLLEHVNHAGTDKGSTVSATTLAADLGCFEKTVLRANKELVGKGLLIRTGRTSKTAYSPNYNSGQKVHSETASSGEVLPNSGQRDRSTPVRETDKKKEKRNTDLMNDLIDHVNQNSFTGPEGHAGAREDLLPVSNTGRICPACGLGEFSDPACRNCGLVYAPTKKPFPPTEDAPRWYQQFARKVDLLNLPEYRDINEAAMLASWSDKTLERAALTYTRHYATQRVTDPVALFRKLVIDAKGKDSAKAPVGRKDQGRKFQEDSLRRRR